MKNILIGLIVCLLLVGCDGALDKVVDIGPMDEMSEKSVDSMKNVFSNKSTV